MSITQLPIPVPSRADPSNFAERGDALLGALPNFVTEANQLANDVNSKSATANTASINAANSAAAAASSAAAAASSAGANLWVSGTSYPVIGTTVRSPSTARIYRKITSAVTSLTTDPANNGTDWELVSTNFDTNYPEVRPLISWDFAGSNELDPRVSFKRNSVASYYDGKTVVRAEENLFKHTDDLSSGYSPSATTYQISSSVTAPDGSLSAAQIICDATSNAHTFTNSTISVLVNRVYTFSCHVKKGVLASAPDIIQLYMGRTGGAFPAAYANFNLSTGVKTAEGGTATGEIYSLGNGWYRVSITATATASFNSSPDNIIGIAFVNNNPTSTWRPTFTSTTAQDVLTWGWQLEEREFVTDYAPNIEGSPYVSNFGSDSLQNNFMTLMQQDANEPRFEYDPFTKESLGLLFEPARTNLCLYSDDISNSYFVANGATKRTGLAYAPDGTLTAVRVVENTANSSHTLQTGQITVDPGFTENYTFSTYFKIAPGTPRGVRLRVYDSLTTVNTFYCHFDAVSKSISSFVQQGTALIREDLCSIKDLGGGWFRLAIVGKIPGSTTMTLRLDTWNGSSVVYTGNGYSGFYTWGWQFELGEAPSSFIRTTTNAVTRANDSFYYAMTPGLNSSGIDEELAEPFTAKIVARNQRIKQPLLSTEDGARTTLFILRGKGGSVATVSFFQGESNSVSAAHSEINANDGSDFNSGTFNDCANNQRKTFVISLGKNSGKFASDGILKPEDTIVDSKNIYSYLILGQSTTLTQNTRLLGTIEKFEVYPDALDNSAVLDLSRG